MGVGGWRKRVIILIVLGRGGLRKDRTQFATIKCILANVCDGFGNSDARQARTTIKRKVADVGSSIGDSDVRQAGAILKRIIANFCDRIGDGDACQTRTARKRAITNVGYRIGDGDARQAGTITVFIKYWYTDEYVLNGRKVMLENGRMFRYIEDLTCLTFIIHSFLCVNCVIYLIY